MFTIPEAASILARMAKKRKRSPKSVLKLPDLEQSELAVLNSDRIRAPVQSVYKGIRAAIAAEFRAVPKVIEGPGPSTARRRC